MRPAPIFACPIAGARFLSAQSLDDRFESKLIVGRHSAKTGVPNHSSEGAFQRVDP